MLKITIYLVGKTKESWLSQAINEYEKRLSSDIEFNYVIKKDLISLEKELEKTKFYICLDEHSLNLTSLEFSKKIFSFFQNNKSNISFVIGSDIGLTKKIRENASFLLSLSKLTFTHQITRLILIEQLYRAIQINKNSKYHK
ncbi:MAG: Ribosomal RNA large subunit methyltransferase H [Candidatus Anoxychlamydiales bacterium]|nr:Ribosomal RNA large subunit methyltransferase H [Candidatus Anoxychlamydiales bacterium]